VAKYTIQHTDTWPKIAGKFGIKYWQNIYLATENASLRRARNENPANFQYGDTLHIPSKSSIRPMELHPVIVHRKIPLFTQNELTCWRATAKMLYLFKYPKSSEAAFNRKIGKKYSQLEKGLSDKFWSDFYVRTLGMTEKKLKFFNDMNYLLATRGPLCAAIGSGSALHAVLINGYDILKGNFHRLDPASGEKFTFSEDVIRVSKPGAPAPKPSQTPGSVKYTPAPAKWETMAGWLGISQTGIHPRVFFY